MTARPQTSTEVAEVVRQASRILPVAGRTKPVLAKTSDAEHLDLNGLSGIMEYEPSEYVFTAKAGTLVGGCRGLYGNTDSTCPSILLLPQRAQLWEEWWQRV